MKKFSYILFYKPYGVLSQFTREGNWKALSDFGPFPNDVYAAGRLDADSEGLLLLTNDNTLKHRLTDPTYEHAKTYLAQVEGIPNEAALRSLRQGVTIEGYRTKPAEVALLPHEPALPPRPKPIRSRANISTSWIELTIREGKNRQVRKMTAAVGHPTLRLVRVRIGTLTLANLLPGKLRELTDEEVLLLRNSVTED